MSFTQGFKKSKIKPLKDIGPTDNNPLRLYPGPEQPWNISGSDKVAAAAGFGQLKPPATSAKGADPSLKAMSSPKRVTPDLGAFGAPKGASGVFGKPVSPPFKKSFGHFGAKPRQALKSITRLKRGM